MNAEQRRALRAAINQAQRERLPKQLRCECERCDTCRKRARRRAQKLEEAA